MGSYFAVSLITWVAAGITVHHTEHSFDRSTKNCPITRTGLQAISHEVLGVEKGGEAVLPNTMCLRRKEKHRKILKLVFGQTVNYSRISAFLGAGGGGGLEI
jgi:hypothetical protein